MALNKIVHKKQIGDNTLLGNTGITVKEYNDIVDSHATLESTINDITSYPVLTKEITVSAAQIDSIHTTPIEVLPAPGTDKLNRIYNITVIDTKNTGFVWAKNSGNSLWQMRYESGSISLYVVDLTNHLTDNSPNVDRVGTYVPENNHESAFINEAIELTSDDSFFGGGRSFKIIVTYQILDASY